MASVNQEVKIPKRILNTLITSLSAGVVPRVGAPYIAIGREEEIGSLLSNLDEVAEGGAACRFLIGKYGSGKSFLFKLGYARNNKPVLYVFFYKSVFHIHLYVNTVNILSHVSKKFNSFFVFFLKIT